MILVDFDLDQAAAGVPMQTRDGRPARYIARIGDPERPVVVAINSKNGEFAWQVTEKGTFFLFGTESDTDLFMVVEHN